MKSVVAVVSVISSTLISGIAYSQEPVSSSFPFQMPNAAKPCLPRKAVSCVTR